MTERGNSLDGEYVAASDAAILERIVDLDDYKRARTLFIYVSRGFEPDTRKLIEIAISEGKTVCVPYITGKGTMCAKQIDGPGSLEQGRFGILTAPADAPVLQKEDIDLAVIPCLGATKRGVRLGYGGGYYDRYFSGERGKTRSYVLCRERMTCETLPENGFDVIFDGIVTENAIYFVDT